MNFCDFDDAIKILKDKKVFIGFSGGSDSTFLILMLNHFKNEIGYDLTAVNFEHGIRGKESEEDTEFCINFCNNLNIPIITKSLNISKSTKNLECIARQKRLEWYKQNLPSGSMLVLGHQADDVIENVLIRMIRGSNLSGLMGLKEFTIYSDSNYIVYRPLLKYRKSEIQDFLIKNGTEWRTDSTNLESDCLRNFIRNEMLSKLYDKFEGSFKGMLLCIQNMSEDSQFIESYADSISNCLEQKEYISVDDLKQYPKCIRHRILKNFADKIGCINLTKGFYAESEKLINSNSQHIMKLSSGNFEITVDKKKIRFGTKLTSKKEHLF